MTVHGRHRYRLRLGDVGALNLELVKAPHLSLVKLLTSPSSSSVAGQTARAARASVRRSGWFGLAPVLAQVRGLYPDVAATPILPTADVSVDEQVQRLRDLPEDAVVEDLARTFGSDLPPVWRPPVDMPRRWLESYASATGDAWSAVSSTWQRAQPLFDLEARRVGGALVRGGADALLNSLHPRMHYVNGEFWVPSMRESIIGLDGRRLVLVPMVAGRDGVLVAFDLPGVVYIAYPLPGQAGLRRHGARAADSNEDPLSLVLGGVRADVLRGTGQPIVMGQLAASVGRSPSAISYHCGQLEAAGLIWRERRGQSVWVSRTPRGHELVDLLGA
jgi:DNA-binding transcriptional ArsR family regulator